MKVRGLSPSATGWLAGCQFVGKEDGLGTSTDGGGGGVGGGGRIGASIVREGRDEEEEHTAAADAMLFECNGL
jgi:hypothetical protein